MSMHLYEYSGEDQSHQNDDNHQQEARLDDFNVFNIKPWFCSIFQVYSSISWIKDNKMLGSIHPGTLMSRVEKKSHCNDHIHQQDAWVGDFMVFPQNNGFQHFLGMFVPHPGILMSILVTIKATAMITIINRMRG
jgi:hypothetical protein